MSKLSELNENQIRQIVIYRKSHSLRETSDWVKEKFGIDVSYITIKRFLEVNWKEISQTELILLNALYNSAMSIIDNYDGLLAAMGKNKKGKLMVLDKYAKFVGDMFCKIDKQNKSVKEVQTVDTKRELDWQKEIEKSE
jgi:hypothetical protein